MANKNIEQFISTYGPVAQQVGKEINVNPSLLLSQWGVESRWGQSDLAKHHNVGGIKDFSGKGHEAKDNKTGSVDKYVKFEDPEVFGMYYVDQIRRNFPQAVNTGDDLGAFTRGLSSGKNGSYFGIPAEEYEKSLANAQAAIPADKAPPFEPTPKPPEQNGDMVSAPAPPAAAPAVDDSGASRGERFLGGAIGAGVGTLVSGGQGALKARTSLAAARAGAEERARIAAQRAAGVAPGIPSAPGSTAPAGTSIMRQPIPSGGLDAGRLAPGQTGTMPYNYGKAAGLTDIEAGRALDMTKREGGVHDLSTQRREGLNKVKNLFPGESYVENPRFGGIMTPDQSVGAGPRVYGPRPIQAQAAQSGALPISTAAAPQIGAGRPPPIPSSPPIPKAASGLDAVADMFKGMMRPIATAGAAIGKYILPPLAGVSAGLDLAEIGHEYDKPDEQRDYTKMALKAAGALGGGLSMFPPTAPVGVPLSIGAAGTQAYREDPEWFKQKINAASSALGNVLRADPSATNNFYP